MTISRSMSRTTVDNMTIIGFHRLMYDWVCMATQVVPQKCASLLFLTRRRKMKQIFSDTCQKMIEIFRCCPRNWINFDISLPPLHTPMDTRWETRIAWFHCKNYRHIRITGIITLIPNTCPRMSITMLPILWLHLDTAFININAFPLSGTVNDKRKRMLRKNLTKMHIPRSKSLVSLRRATFPRYFQFVEPLSNLSTRINCSVMRYVRNEICDLIQKCIRVSNQIKKEAFDSYQQYYLKECYRSDDKVQADSSNWILFYNNT